MSDGLTLIIATRERPERLVKMLDQTAPNIKRGDTKVLICVDDDDKETIAALGKVIEKDDPNIVVSVKPREDTRGEKYDRALTEAPNFLYVPAHDSCPCLTPGFDEILIKKAKLFPDGIGVVHSPMIHKGTFPPAWQGMTAKWVEKVGYIYNPDYPFWFIDHEVHDLARMVGRYFLANIHIEPDHPGKTIRLHDLLFWCGYYDLMALERRAKARAIIDSPDFLTPDWQKADLRENYLKFENEGRRINNSVRKDAADIEARRGLGTPTDEGYLRAKARAEQKLSNLLEALKAAA